MAWFSHVRLDSDQKQQLAADSHSFTASDVLCGSLSTGFTAPTGAPLTPGCSAPSPGDFPPAPRGLSSPPSLENLTCSSSSAAQVRDLEPISYVSLQEQRCVLSWFQGWSLVQKERFLQDLLGKAVPGKVCTLLGSLSTLQVPHRANLPAHFQSRMSSVACHLKFWVVLFCLFVCIWTGSGQRQATEHLWVPAAPVDPMVWVLVWGREESLPAHAWRAGPWLRGPLLQECSRHSQKRLKQNLACEAKANVKNAAFGEQEPCLWNNEKLVW